MAIAYFKLSRPKLYKGHNSLRTIALEQFLVLRIYTILGMTGLSGLENTGPPAPKASPYKGMFQELIMFSEKKV